MYLKKIEMQGFKSFADRISISLENGITAIVGPNGSGKSNIADAVRWVLGEQSVKSLRSSRMDDVIFSGTEHRKPSGLAEVTLLIDNTDGGLPVPYSDVSVTRRIYRSGESEYLLNKSQCRLKDINEIFYDTGIGREGYTIIGQGKVETILNNKPEERRGMFEEAAGIAKYKARRGEAERKLDATSQNLLRINDIIGELELQMGVLEGQAEVARKYLELRDELKEIEVAGYVSSIGKFEASLAKCRDGCEMARGEYEKQTKALADIDASAIQLQKRAALIDEAQAGLNRAILDIETRLSNNSNQINLNNEKTGRAKSDIERVRNEILHTGERKAGHGAELEANMKKLAYLTGELLRYDGLLGEAKAGYEAVLSTLGESDKAIEMLKADAEAAREKYYNDSNRLAGMHAELDHYKRAAGAIEKNIASIINDIDAARLAGEELAEQKNALASKSGELHGVLKDLSQKRFETGAALDNKKREAGDMANELNTARTRMKALSDMEDNFEGFYASVRRVLTECRRNSVFGDGIYGAVASLINVPKELETAISMALGPAQQNIVTRSEGDAARAVAYLKSTSGGRATFLPISTVRGRALADNIREKLAGQPGYIGAAPDLIKYDAVYGKAISELLGSTVIVDTLDSGLALASGFRHMFRIVTLEGDIIAPGGAITGGSIEAKGPGILGRRREIPELASAAAGLEARIAEASRGVESMEDTLAGLVKKIAASEKSQNEFNVEEAALLQRISHLEDKLKTDIDRRGLYKIELDETAKNADELEQVILELSASLEGQSGHITDIQSEIDAYTGKNREEQRRRDDLLSDISAYNVSVASVTEARKAVSDAIERLEEELADSEKSIAAREASIRRFSLDIEKYETETEALRIAADQIEQEKRGALLRIESSAAEKASIHAETLSLTDDTGRVNGLLAGITREIGRFEAREARIQAELDHCRNRLWEDYELTYHNALALLKNTKNANDAEEPEAEDPGTDEDGTEPIDASEPTDASEPASAAARSLNPLLMGGAAARRAARIRDEMRALGPVNVLSIDEFAQTKGRHEKMDAQKRDMEEAGDKLRLIIGEMSLLMSRNFEEQFKQINKNFDIVFKELFSGGQARLTLTEGREILEAGVEIEIQLPGKRMQNMALYSGGERALTAIALIFAMLMLKPVPFCLLDEIESALDEANIERFARYIRKYSGDTQFIMVTHRKGTMENSDVLYGVTMRERGVSGVVSLRLSDAS